MSTTTCFLGDIRKKYYYVLLIKYQITIFNINIGTLNSLPFLFLNVNKSIYCILICLKQLDECNCSAWPRGYKTFFMLNLAEYKIFSANKYENANNSWHFHII